MHLLLVTQSKHWMNFWRANSAVRPSRSKSGAAVLRHLIFLLVVAMGAAACSGSKALTKRGAQMEDAGLYEEAANFYFNALLRNNSNVEARIGLTNTSKRVLNDRLDKFSRHRAMEEHQEAYSAFQQAVDYKERMDRLGIGLEIPNHYAEDFETSKDILVRDLYKQGNDLMAEKKFDDAKLIFKQIQKMEPGYKDVENLKGVARNEPLYQRATTYFDEGRYRQAFFELDEIYAHDPDYRDVAILREECLNLGRYPIALSPFENASGAKEVEKRVYAYFVTALSQIDDPFLRVVERGNMETILDEQRLSLSGVVDQNTATQVGNLLGAKALLSATVLTYSSRPGRLSVTSKDGFESYSVKLYNASTEKHYYETRYKPVKYNEYYQRNEVRVSVQYKAISLESGELLFSRIVDRTAEDQMYYAAYDGEVNRLLPAGPSGVLTSNRERNQLQNLIRAPRTIKSVDDLTNNAFNSLTTELQKDLLAFLDSL